MCAIIPAVTDPAVAHWEFGVSDAFLVIGTPKIELAVELTVGTQAELAVRLWDVAPDGLTQTMVSRGIYRHFAGDSLAHTVSFELATTGWEFLTGHTIKVEVTGNDAPAYQASNQPAVIAVDSMTLQLPGANDQT